MGRTNPTFRDTLRALEDRWQPFRRALRYEDQARFDRLVAHARDHADAAGTLNHRSPVVPVLVAVALAQERRLDELEARLADGGARDDRAADGRTKDDRAADGRAGDGGEPDGDRPSPDWRG